MREVSEFVVVFPARFLGADSSEVKLLLDAMRREYPHYRFEGARGRLDLEEFQIIPVMGTIGDGEGANPEEVYMCKPLDPKVIPDLVSTLGAYAALGGNGVPQLSERGSVH